MNTRRLQFALDEILATTMQRWLLMVSSVASIVAASAAIARATEFNDTAVVIFVAFLALLVAVEPDEHLGLVLVGIVVLHWIVLEPSVTSPWSMALAGSLHVFHSTVALMAVTPHTAIVHRDVLLRWAARSTAVACCTVFMWVLVFAFEQREVPGNAVLSAMAVAVLAAAVIVFRERSLPGRG